MTRVAQQPAKAPRRMPVVVGALIAFAVLVGLGTWQVQRLHWKETLIATIEQRVASAPKQLSEVEQQFRETGDVDYQPVSLEGECLHAGERHFFATWKGETGFYVYTPLKLADARLVFVNRGFVPYELKDVAKREQGQRAGPVTVIGLARNPLPGKPGMLLPDNEPSKNIFYWKDRDAMAASAGLPEGSVVLPFFVDADAAANRGGWPAGGVTMVDLPNNHLQYAVTWYGLAAALAGVAGLWLWRQRHGGDANP